jgi:hypothetical protein
MTDISDDTLETLRNLGEQLQKAQQRYQLVYQTVFNEHGLDPEDHQLDLQEGVIREVEDAGE